MNLLWSNHGVQLKLLETQRESRVQVSQSQLLTGGGAPAPHWTVSPSSIYSCGHEQERTPVSEPMMETWGVPGHSCKAGKERC